MSAALDARWSAANIGSHRVLGPTHVVIEAARWTAVVGPNGAGKSTLLRALAGLQPVLGSVALQGRPLREWPPLERARTLAWMGQSEAGADAMTAYEVVMLGRLPHHGWLATPLAGDHAAVERAMGLMQCWQWRDRPLATLSGGERQRVLLARAWAVQAGVLLLDEPLTHLDPPHQADWMEVVRDQVRAGLTCVSVLHELHVALQADRLIVMAGGRVVHQGAPGHADSHRALQSVFDHRLQLVQVEGRWIALPRTAR